MNALLEPSRTKPRRFVGLFSIAVIAGVVATALASTVAAAPDFTKHPKAKSTLFAVGQGGEVLLAIDVNKGETSVVGPTGFPFNCCPPLAIQHNGNGGYTIANSANPAVAQLARINLQTGASSLVGEPLGEDLFIMGMTFSPNGRVLYAVGDVRANSPTFNSLYTIDVRTGAASRVGSLGVSSPSCEAGPLCFSRFVMSLSFDPDGNLFGATTTALYRINRATGGATKVVDFAGSSAVMGLAFADDGALYAADYINLPAGSTVYKVNPGTGVLTPVVRTGIALVHNIAFIP